MKKYITKFCTALTMVLVAFTSCDTDVEGVKYDTNEANVAFASTQMIVELTAEDNGMLQIPVYRGYAGSDLSVQVELDGTTIAEGVFTLMSNTVTFKSGENIAYAQLNFDLNSLSAINRYEMTLTVADESVLSPAGWGQLAVTASKKLTWEKYGTGTYTSELFGEAWEQPIEKAIEGNIYRLPDCTYKNYHFIFTLSDDGQTLLSWDPQAIGYRDEGYGMIYFSATAMTRSGNKLSFTTDGLVIVDGSFGVLYEGLTEELEFPD